ncbi:DNA-directed RNA polymerase subunit omega [candidate division KSB1 bacterium]|nr:DNA-directed RNA polymerase subunit omega [candidate division KSB1 bacterium]
MGVTTTNLEDLVKNVGNIYEAIVVIAKRARQINEEQKMIIETELGIDSDNEGYEEDQDEIERGEEISYLKLPKPTRIALEELLAGKLNFEYLNKDEQE